MKTKIISVILAVVMLFSLTQTVAFATDSETIDVYFSTTNDEIIVELGSLTVEQGIAEDYGYTVSANDHNGVAVDGVTVLDVLVAAHVKYYGDDFTAQTAEDYLSVSYGFLQKAFGMNATASGFTVNNEVPHDDIMTNYGYTGYAADTAVVEDGDFVSLFFYQDSRYYTDVLASLGTIEETVTPGESFTYTLSGYYAAYYGCSDEDTIADNTEILSDVDVFMKEVNEETFTKIGTTDENGQITVDFENEGEYILYATGETDSECPIIYTWSIVHVNNETPDEPSVIEEPIIPVIIGKINAFFANIWTLIYNILSSVYSFVVNLFNLF